MNQIDLEQNSPAWLKWRSRIVTATDCAAIMGVSPYRTPLQCWEEKLGLKTIVENDAMRWGKDNEELARQNFIFNSGIYVQPGCFQRDFIGASLDGISQDRKTIVEIKCPTPRNTMDWVLAKRGVIPDKYYPQVQAQCYVCGVDSVTYYHYNVIEKIGIPIVINRDDEYIDTLLLKAKAFYDCLTNLLPPEGTEADYSEIEFEPCRQDVLRYKEISTQIRYLEQERERLKHNVSNYCKELGINGKVDDIKICQRFRKGSVDYSKVPQLLGVDLEPYRKDKISYWQIT